MAELTVLLAAKKIGGAFGGEAQKLISSIFANEVSLLTQLPSSMNRIKREFVVMQAFLSNIDPNEENNSVEVWLQEVRKIAHNVEDVTDELVYLLGENRIRGLCSLIHKIIRRPHNIVGWHRVASQLKEIECDLQHVTQIKDRWIKMPESSTNYACIEQMDLTDPSQDVSKGEILDIHEEEKKELIEQLKCEDKARSIMSLWGQAGVGKTFLAFSVYRSEKNEFDCRAWISVRVTENSRDLLKSVIEKFYRKETVSIDTGSMSHGELTKTLREFLEDKRYLLVLDDVRETQLLVEIKNVLPENNQRSRIIITTDNKDVARFAGHKHIEVKPLKHDKAMELFVNKTFDGGKDSACPKELNKLAEKIVKKCSGLPLAIASMASLLSLRKTSQSEWDKVNKQLGWLLQHDPNLGRAKLTLTLSLKDLPRYLKICFLFCSIFPKDFKFKRKTLIRLWVAEGFIEERGQSTLEEVAEDYVNELVHRCMFQVIDRNDADRVKVFQMHPFVLEIVMSISKKENFSMRCDNLEAIKYYHEARRLSLYNCPTKTTSTVDLPQLRSLMVLETDISLQLLSSVLSNSRYLMVLDLQGSNIESLPDAIGDLFNLRYLCLRRSRVKLLPRSVGRLLNMQTLDLYCTRVMKLPREITKLKKLRHLFVGNHLDLSGSSFPAISGVRAPEGMLNLKRLQTLKGMEASQDLVRHLRKLTQLRSLRIQKIRRTHCTELFSSLKKMTFLSALQIFAIEEEVLDLGKVDRLPQNLQKLVLQGQLVEEGAQSLFRALGENLKLLNLGWSGLKQDPLDFLSHLKNLAHLTLNNAYDGDQLKFSEEWFPHLKSLALNNMAKLKQVIIVKGALKKLQIIELVQLRELKKVQGIEYAESLKEMRLYDMSPDFREGVDKSKIDITKNNKHDLQGVEETPRSPNKFACC